MTPEHRRLEEARKQKVPWLKWGPYLSERQWGTVREDYSENGDAWNYFSHDQARSRAYRWGEDGIAGISDDKQRLCFALALWNGKDPIIKERLFGLTNGEGNHGEDVKEYYFYLDSTPTHSYMKFLYKYPQKAYPYNDLVWTNRSRSRHEPEYELLDTGVFENNEYFDVFVESAKKDPDDICIRITVCNRNDRDEDITVLPTLWFRNTWSWQGGTKKPALNRREFNGRFGVIEAVHEDLGRLFFYCEGNAPLLFTENETNHERIFGSPNASPYVKDGINNYIVFGRHDAVNPKGTGTKAAAFFKIVVPAKGETAVRLKLSNAPPEEGIDVFGKEFENIMAARLGEADAFYRLLTPRSAGEEQANVLRQAMAGMLWSKQYYFFDADRWLEEHNADPLGANSRPLRNKEWFHMVNDHVISMPDKWEYPWYAAWDLAFHTIALSVVDMDFARDQLDLMLRVFYQHPSGQIPAYEWNFSDVNPPVHAWATLFLHRTEQALSGEIDLNFLKQSFAKLVLNFTWWVNRKDRFGKNVFDGGFLGLDNIGVFDRSAPLPAGGYLEQADGTAWMSLFCQNMLELSVELAAHDRAYEDMALKFAEHFLWIASAINRVGREGMWDEEDGFYYDLLRFPDGGAARLKVRSMVGLLPLCATTVIEERQREGVPNVVAGLKKRLQHHPELLKFIHPTGPDHLGVNGRGIFALVNPGRLRRILARMLDEHEFLGPFGIRSLSRYHLDHPYKFILHGQEYDVGYLPGESDTGMFGGNSNWRGPVWFPVNVLLIRALLSFYTYYGDSFKIECPTGSGRVMNLFEVSSEIANRLIRIFLRADDGRRPVYGDSKKFQSDPLWRDHILFYEYFNGDDGAGLGASHQTGWTGLVGKLIQLFGILNAHDFLEGGRDAVFAKVESASSR